MFGRKRTTYRELSKENAELRRTIRQLKDTFVDGSAKLTDLTNAVLREVITKYGSDGKITIPKPIIDGTELHVEVTDTEYTIIIPKA